MSYLFDSANDTLTGTFTSTYADPVTLACFVKITAHPVATDALLSFGNSASSLDHSYVIRTDIADDGWVAVARDIANFSAVLPNVNVDGIWAAVVGVFTGNTLREIFVKDPALTASTNVAVAVNDVLQFIRLGESFTGVQDYGGMLAESAIWNKALETAEITRYMSGIRASHIAAANLIGYWPLSSSNAIQENLGVDTGGDLTVTGAVFDPDHPNIIDLMPLKIPGRRKYAAP